MNPYIFRKEDIRGIVGRDWEPQDAYAVGRAFGCFLRQKGERAALLGRDNRISSKPIYNHFLRGLLEMGLNITDLGLTTTPQVYWARIFLKIRGAAMITGSHNPLEWNGLKLCLGGQTTIFGDDLEQVKSLSFENEDYFKRFVGQGMVTELDTSKDYIADILSHLPKTTSKMRPKVVVDSGNGMAGLYIKEILKELNCDILTLHSRLDGTFPNHMPDPSRGENILELVNAVTKHKADVGLAFDGDVDRINIIDEAGFALWGDGATAFFAKDILESSPVPDSAPLRPNNKILLNTQCSPAIYNAVKRWGGDPDIIPTGHALVSELVVSKKALLGGEYKGHIYFRDYYYGFDDALYAAARVITALRRFENTRISNIMSDVEFYYSTGEISIPVSDSRKFELERQMERAVGKKYQMEAHDGDIRIDFGDGSFGLARNSDTTPKFEIYAWARDIKTLGKRRDYLVDLVQDKLLNDYNTNS